MNTVVDQYHSHNSVTGWNTGATFKITLGQHDVNNVWVQVGEHLLHALNDPLFHGAGQRSAGWNVLRHNAVKLSGSPMTCVVVEASPVRRPAGSPGRALVGFLPARHSGVQVWTALCSSYLLEGANYVATVDEKVART